MELILKSNNEQSIAKIITLAKRLNVVVEKVNEHSDLQIAEDIKNRILNFKATLPASFGDAQTWEREQRRDRDLPFSK